MISCFEALTDCGLGDAYVKGLLMIGVGFILPICITLGVIFFKFHKQPNLREDKQ